MKDIGIYYYLKNSCKPKKREYGNYIYAMGLMGGLTDAMGGGGWGPVVISTLLAQDMMYVKQLEQ